MTHTHGRHLDLLLCALVLLGAGAAGADTYLVDRLDDSTTNGCDPATPLDCGLRGALILANSNPGDDVVRLQAGTYSLSIPGTYENLCELGDLDVLDTVLVEGMGPELTVVDAGGPGGLGDRVFDLHAPGKRLTLRGLSVTGGECASAQSGCAIGRSVGSLRLESCVVSGNSASQSSGTVIDLLSAGSGDLVEIVDSWITGNTGHYSILQVIDVHIERSTVSGNSLGSYGGTVEIFGDDILLVDSTLEGSTGATTGPSVMIWGTGAAVKGCTLVGGVGWAIQIASAGSATIENSLVVGECGALGVLTTLGGNLESPGNSCQLGGSDLVNVADPGLSALGFFGGPAPVRRPLPTSPALDQPLAGPGCGTADQRGLSRPRDGDGNGTAACDIGAVELAGPGEVFVETFECGFTTGWSAVVD